MENVEEPKKYSRRDVIKTALFTGASVAISAISIGAIVNISDKLDLEKAKVSTNSEMISFYGKHQAGIITAQQDYFYFIAIPSMPRDDLQVPYVGGDICIQVCANNQQVAFHAAKNFIKAAEVKWI